jgi:peroxiredoxin
VLPLLSDWNGDAVRGFGIARDYRGMRDVAHRSAFLVDTDGTILGAWSMRTATFPTWRNFSLLRGPSP